MVGRNGGLGKLNDLAGIETAVSRKNKADDAYQSKQIYIAAAEHLHTQYNGGKRGIGSAAEQTDQAQCCRNPRLKAQNATQYTAKGCSDRNSI